MYVWSVFRKLFSPKTAGYKSCVVTINVLVKKRQVYRQVVCLYDDCHNWCRKEQNVKRIRSDWNKINIVQLTVSKQAD